MEKICAAVRPTCLTRSDVHKEKRSLEEIRKERRYLTPSSSADISCYLSVVSIRLCYSTSLSAADRVICLTPRGTIERTLDCFLLRTYCDDSGENFLTDQLTDVEISNISAVCKYLETDDRRQRPLIDGAPL